MATSYTTIEHDDRRDGCDDYYQLFYTATHTGTGYVSFYENSDDAIEALISCLLDIQCRKVGLVTLEHMYHGETDTMVSL